MDKNKPIAKINFLNQLYNDNKNYFNVELIATLIAILEVDYNINSINKVDLISGLLAIKANKT